jgi:hypothetical protein
MKKLLVAASSILLALQPGVAAAQTIHDNKVLLDLHEDGARPCALFRLQGVTSADPVTGTEWFALPRTHLAFSELFAMLLTAAALNRPIYVSTKGTLSCGFAAVDAVLIKS